MRLGIARTQPSRGVDRGDGVIGAHRALAPVDRSNFQIDHAGQQQAALADRLPDARAGEGRIAGCGHLGVIALRIAIAQVIGDAAFGPQDEAVALRFQRPAQPRGALELLLEPRGVVNLVLP